MDEFIARQCTQMRFAIWDYRQGTMSLNNLIARIESLAQAIGEEFWSEDMFPIAVDLERINSDLIGKQRKMTPMERDQIEQLLADVEGLINKQSNA